MLKIAFAVGFAMLLAGCSVKEGKVSMGSSGDRHFSNTYHPGAGYGRGYDGGHYE